MDHGVRIFRVDNPHTKPVAFWEWLIAQVRETDPDVIFLAEAFTRPAMMHTLGKVGFHQSYTYFTWRNTKAELQEYLTELSGAAAAYMRPNFFVNTPDILPFFLQYGGPPAFKIRAVLAAMLAPTWGVYAGFELYEHVALARAARSTSTRRNSSTGRATGRPPSARAGALRPTDPAQRDPARAPGAAAAAQPRFHRTDGRFDPLFLQARGHRPAQRHGHRRGQPGPARCARDHGPPGHARAGMDWWDTFDVHDEISGATFRWGEHNYVRLDPFVEPAHILTVRRGTA